MVLNFNGRHHLETCLTSLLKQTHSNFEVILVDNGSTDGSEDYVTRTFPQVKVIRLQKNIGFCGGNNVGIRAAAGEYIALLNNDTEVAPQWLEALCMTLQRNPSAGLCASRMLRFSDRTIVDNAGDTLTPGGFGAERGRGCLDGPEFDADCEVFGACAGAALYRRTLFEEVGLLDEHLFLTFEDLDFSFRARLAGYKCYYSGKAVVYHKVRGTMSQFPAQQIFQSQRNIEWVWLKNMPGWLMFKYLPHRILYWAGAAWFFSRNGRGGTFLRAKGAAILGVGQVLRQRRRIQSARRITCAELERVFNRGWLAAKLNQIRLASRRSAT